MKKNKKGSASGSALQIDEESKPKKKGNCCGTVCWFLLLPVVCCCNICRICYLCFFKACDGCLASLGWYTDMQVSFREHIEELFDVINRKHNTAADTVCNCGVEVLDQVEGELFISNVDHVKNNMQQRYAKYKHYAMLMDMVDHVKAEFKRNSTNHVNEVDFINSMTDYFLEVQVQVIKRLTATLKAEYQKHKVIASPVENDAPNMV